MDFQDFPFLIELTETPQLVSPLVVKWRASSIFQQQCTLSRICVLLSVLFVWFCMKFRWVQLCTLGGWFALWARVGAVIPNGPSCTLHCTKCVLEDLAPRCESAGAAQSIGFIRLAAVVLGCVFLYYNAVLVLAKVVQRFQGLPRVLPPM